MLGGDSLKVRTCWDSERSVTSPKRMLAVLITVEINISVGCRSACFFTFKICLLTCRRVRSCSKTSEKNFSCSRANTEILISLSHLLMKCVFKKSVSLTSDSYCSKWEVL